MMMELTLTARITTINIIGIMVIIERRRRRIIDDEKCLVLSSLSLHSTTATTMDLRLTLNKSRKILEYLINMHS